jgi:hypothetical protein
VIVTDLLQGAEMSNYRYLIIGGGMTSYAAINGIRSIDSDASIGLISAEIYPPYKRNAHLFPKACGRESLWKKFGIQWKIFGSICI